MKEVEGKRKREKNEYSIKIWTMVIGFLAIINTFIIGVFISKRQTIINPQPAQVIIDTNFLKRYLKKDTVFLVQRDTIRITARAKKKGS